MKLFHTTLDLLPNVKATVWRGVSSDIGQNLTKDQLFTWWAVSSCSTSINVIQRFLNDQQHSALFLIEIVHGKNTSGFTEFEQENEIVLKMGTRLQVKADPLRRTDGSFTVYLIEIDDTDDDDDKQSLATATESLNVNTKYSEQQLLDLTDLNMDTAQGGNNLLWFYDIFWFTWLKMKSPKVILSRSNSPVALELTTDYLNS